MHKVLDKIQQYIDRTTMYKVVSSGLTFLIVISLIASILNLTGFSIVSALLSLTILLVTNVVFNKVVSNVLNIPPHQESTIITAFILYLLYTPTKNIQELCLLGIVSLISVLSKYLITKNKTHILNPVAAAAVLSSVLLNYPATWWVGSSYMLIPVTLVALVILRKQRKFSLALTFLITSLVLIYITYSNFYTSIIELLYQTFLTWPLIFFASVMLTEPFTLPQRKNLETVYAVLIGILSVIPFHIWKIGTSPEVALLVGNIIAFVLLPKNRYLLKLKSKIEIAPTIYKVVFEPDRKIKFEAGQYIEIMLPHKNQDIRGERRYFTIASSPIEKEVTLIIRLINSGSTFKKYLSELELNTTLYGQQIRGDFTLDTTNTSSKYLFIAGGIGITPFISIVSYLLTKKKQSNATLLFISSKETDFIYKELWEKAKKLIGLKVHYLTKEQLSKTFITTNIAEYKEHMVYISGPNTMVQTYTELFSKLGIKKRNIKTDYFNGF